MRQGLLLFGIIIVSLATTALAQTPLVEVAEPRDGAVVTAPAVIMTGRVEASIRPAAVFDVVLVIDTSGSTRMPASIGDSLAPSGIFTVPFGIGGASILETQVAAARRFTDIADPASTRIGVVTFSEGSMFRSGNAWVEQSLTSDYSSVREALRRVGGRTPHGGTDMVAGMRLAVRELRALQGSESSPRPQARKVILFMTDGFPTLPYPSGAVLDERNVTATLTAARLAARGEVVVHTFCLGREALSAPVVCRETARITGGQYHPVQRPADIVELLPATRIAQLDLVSVRNATTGQMARRLDMDASGRFSADVPLAPGANRLVAQVQGAAAEAGMATVVVHYRAAGNVDIKVERPDPKLDIRIERDAPNR